MVRQGRLVGLAGVLVVGAILFWPWQRRLEASLLLRMQDAAHVYATVPGQLVSHLEPGQDDIERIKLGAPVSIRLEHTPGWCWQGQVTQVSRVEAPASST